MTTEVASFLISFSVGFIVTSLIVNFVMSRR